MDKLSTGRDVCDSEGIATIRPRTLIKNSVANVITGVATTLLAVVMPPVLARTLSSAEFSTWALILQIAGYTSLLNLGMQGAVGRYVSYYLACGDRRSGEEFTSTAFAVLCFGALVAILGVTVATLFLGDLFPAMPDSLLLPAKFCLCLVGAVLSCALPVSVLNGVFAGIQRNELIAAIVGPCRALLAASLAAGAILSHSITVLAEIFAVLNAASFWATWICFRRSSPVQLAVSHISSNAFREILHYCSSVMIWNIAMLLISGADTIIVGRVDFARVAIYAACLAPVTVLAGMQQALFGPLMQVGALQSANADREGLNNTLVRATRLGVLVLLFPVSMLLLFKHEILDLWLGVVYAKQAVMIFPMLLAGHAARLIAMPYSTLLLATGEHRRVIAAPLIEGLTNVIVAILAGITFGAVGVAAGVIVGAFMSQLLNYFYNLPRTHASLPRGKFLLQAILIPNVCFLPVVVGLMAVWTSLPLASSVLVRGLLLVVSSLSVWTFALKPADKEPIVKILRDLVPVV